MVRLTSHVLLLFFFQRKLQTKKEDPPGDDRFPLRYMRLTN